MGAWNERVIWCSSLHHLTLLDSHPPPSSPRRWLYQSGTAHPAQPNTPWNFKSWFVQSA